MRVLVAGDLHFDKEHFEWIQKRQFDFECICLTGDYLDLNKGELTDQVKWIQNWVGTIKVPLFICSGNHDVDDFGESEWLQDLSSYNVYVDGAVGSVNGMTFGVVPYLGAFWDDYYDCDVLVTHVPPAKTQTSQTLVQGIRKDWGDEELYMQLSEKILTPKYLFCGHVEAPLCHKDQVSNVLIINPGEQSQTVEIE